MLSELLPDMVVVPGRGATPSVTVRSLNSQAAEQRNSLLERVRTQIAYMSHDNVVLYLNYFLGARNDMLRTGMHR